MDTEVSQRPKRKNSANEKNATSFPRSQPKNAKKLKGELPTNANHVNISAANTSAIIKSQQNSLSPGINVPVTKPQKTTKPKPIVAEVAQQIVIRYIKDSSINLSLNDIEVRSIIREDKKQSSIQCSSLEVKEKVLKILKDKSINLHTFTETANKIVVFVLKNFDVDSNPAEILEELKEHTIPATKVTTIVKSTATRKAVHLVHFPKEATTIQQLNQQFRLISGARVTWEVQLRDKKMPTQ